MLIASRKKLPNFVNVKSKAKLDIQFPKSTAALRLIS